MVCEHRVGLQYMKTWRVNLKHDVVNVVFMKKTATRRKPEVKKINHIDYKEEKHKRAFSK